MAENKMPTPAELKEHQRVMREFRQQGQAALTWGLPNPATEAAVLGMGLVLREKLAEASASSRATEAAALAAQMLERTVQRMPQAPSYQCAKGCNFCCHSAVSVSAPEVFRIVGLLAGAGGTEREALIARAKARSGGTVEAVAALRTACPLLVDGACSVYAERPMGCRQFVSTNIEGCRTAFEKGSDMLPFVQGAANAGLVVRSLLISAASSLGLKSETYELSSALVIALASADAERCWLAGEDVLAGALKMPQPPNMQSSVQRWSQMLSGLYV